MRTIKTTVYTINEHPNPEKCFQWVWDNWHDLNQCSLDEFILSLKALKKEIGGELDYAVSAVPDRGECIRIKNYDRDALMNLDKQELPLTGVCWDYFIIEAAQNGYIEDALSSLHDDTHYKYSDEGLEEFLESNGYEFTENGELI